jgi:hypothetical protein
MVLTGVRATLHAFGQGRTARSRVPGLRGSLRSTERRREGRKEGGAPLVELVAGTARGLRLRWWPSAADGALPPRGGPRDRPTRGERREPARNCGGPLLDLICCCCPLGHVRSLWAE